METNFNVFFSAGDQPAGLFERISQVVSNNSWICPIKHDKDYNYYSISKNEIMIPDEKYLSADEYYGTLTHLMAHSVRDFVLEPLNGCEEYSKEELICECTSAILLSMIGMKKTLNEDSVPYRKIWEREWVNESYRKGIEQRVKERLFTVIGRLYECK